METFKWAYIGTGKIAYKTARSITRTGRHEIVSVWNRTTSKSIKFSSRFKSKLHSTAEEAMNDDNVDAIYISLTTDQHEKYVLKALSLNKPILVEKSFSANYEQAKRMFDEAKARNVYLSEAMWTWYNHTAYKVKDWLDNKEIGQIISVKMSLGYPIVNRFKNHRLKRLESCGGAMLDLGVYPLHYAYRLFGYPESIDCKGNIKKGVDYNSIINLHYLDFTVRAHISINQYLKETVIIKGTNGYIKIPRFHQANYAILSNDKGKEIYKDSKKQLKDLYIAEFDNVAKEVLECQKSSILIPQDAVLKTTMMMDVCRKQLRVAFPSEQ